MAMKWGRLMAQHALAFVADFILVARAGSASDARHGEAGAVIRVGHLYLHSGDSSAGNPSNVRQPFPCCIASGFTSGECDTQPPRYGSGPTATDR